MKIITIIVIWMGVALYYNTSIITHPFWFLIEGFIITAVVTFIWVLVVAVKEYNKLNKHKFL